MEGNLPTGNMMPVAPFGMLDLQNPVHVHHPQHQHPSFLHHHPQNPNNLQRQGSTVHQQIHDMFPQSVNHMQELPMMDNNRGVHGKPSCSDDDEPSYANEDGVHGHDECGRGKKGWQRMKWTDQMVRLLITAVSYLGEDVTSDCHRSGKRKYAILQKKGKWKSISKVLAERGCYVSPQQCEDKFNDLNKRYKRLTDILGRGTSCKVVENPALLDMMDNLTNKAKEDARKILSSKHLFYEEMCSYHNGNRVNLPADPALQRSLQLALRSRDDHDLKRGVHDDHDDDDVDSDDDNDHAEEHGGSIFPKWSTKGDAEEHGGSIFPKWSTKGVDHEELGYQDCHARTHAQGITVDMNEALAEGSKGVEYMKSRKVQLEEQSLHIQAEMLELKKQRFKWLRFSEKKDRELEKMRMENERMKFENERLELELKCKELELNIK